MRSIIVSLVLVLVAGCAKASPPLIPKEFLTPELTAYLETEEGKELVHSFKSSLIEEQNRNMADPVLARYFQLLKQGDNHGAFQAVVAPAHAGHSQAQTELAYLYQTGTGTDKNIDEAIKWYAAASEQGNLMATSGLASIYLYPQFSRQNIDLARPLLKKCAFKLRASCVASMTYLYITQDKPDISKAFAWASIGADNGLPGSKEYIAQLQPQMTSADYSAAIKDKSAIVSEMLAQ
jgi:TPR repeat protein